jgi:hypothetical protein
MGAERALYIRVRQKNIKRAAVAIIYYVSEFLQIVGNMAFFMAIQVRKPHGMME